MYYRFDKAKIFFLLSGLILHSFFTDCMELVSPENQIHVMLKQKIPGIVFDKDGFDTTEQKKNVLLAFPILKEFLKKKLKKREKMYGEYIDFDGDQGDYCLTCIKPFKSFLEDKKGSFTLPDQKSFLTIVEGVSLYDPMQYLPDWYPHLQDHFLTLKTQFKKECGISFGSWSKKNANVSIEERYRSLFKELFFLTVQPFGVKFELDEHYLFLQQFILLGCNEKSQLKDMFSLVESEANVSYLKNKLKLNLAQNHAYVLSKLEEIIDENKELINIDNSLVNAYPLQHRLYVVQVFLNQIARYGGNDTDIFPVQDRFSTLEQYALMDSMLKFYALNKKQILKLKVDRLKATSLIQTSNIKIEYMNYEDILNKLIAILDAHNDVIDIDSALVNLFPLNHKLYLLQVFLNFIGRKLFKNNRDIFPLENLLSILEQYALMDSMLKFYESNKKQILELKVPKVNIRYLRSNFKRFFNGFSAITAVGLDFFDKKKDTDLSFRMSEMYVQFINKLYEAKRRFKPVKSSMAQLAKTNLRCSFIFFDWKRSDFIKSFDPMNDKSGHSFILFLPKNFFDGFLNNASGWLWYQDECFFMCRQYEICKKIFKFWNSEPKIFDIDVKNRLEFAILVLRLIYNIFLDLKCKAEDDDELGNCRKNYTYNLSMYAEKIGKEVRCFNTVDDLKTALNSVVFTYQHVNIFKSLLKNINYKFNDSLEHSMKHFFETSEKNNSFEEHATNKDFHSLLDLIWPTILNVYINNSTRQSDPAFDAMLKEDQYLVEQCELLFKKLLCGRFLTEPPATKSKKVLNINENTYQTVKLSFFKKILNTFVSLKLVQNILVLWNFFAETKTFDTMLSFLIAYFIYFFCIRIYANINYIFNYGAT